MTDIRRMQQKGIDMKPFGKAFKDVSLSLLCVVGMTALFILGCYGIIVFFNATSALEDAGLQGLGCGLLCLLYYPLAILLGILAVVFAGMITKSDLRLIWLPMTVLAAAVFCYGHLVSTGNNELLPVPEVIRPFTDTLASIPESSGIYCMLYGGAMMLALLYNEMRISFLMAIPKMLLQVAVLIVPLAMCINYNFVIHPEGLMGFLSWPAMVIGVVFCGILGYIGPTFFAHSVGGHMRPFFWFMYLFSIVVGLIGLALTVGVIFDANLLHELVRAYLTFVPDHVTNMMEDLNGLVMGIGLLLLGVFWLVDTIAVSGKRCSRCKMYAHESVEDLGHTSAQVVGNYTTTSSTHTKTRYYHNGGHRDYYKDTKDTYEKVAYTGKESVHCRYCGYDFGTRTYHGTYDNLIDSQDDGEHSEYHFF